MASGSPRRAQDLPADNAARLVLFDAISQADDHDAELCGLSDDALFNRVSARLRVLVPRELHLVGEREYVQAKIEACVEEGILRRDPSGWRVRLGTQTPKVRYPDGTIRDYTVGLEAARERLDADETRLRRSGFDIRRLVRSAADDRKSVRFQSLVVSMHEHGFLDQFPVTMSATGEVIDGVARIAAAAEAEVPMKLHHSITLPPRRDTPIHHILLVFDANSHRLSEETRASVRDAVEARSGRTWYEIENDLLLTRAWRRTVPKKYTAMLDVKLVTFANQHEPKVQITRDETRVGLRSVMQQAGLADYNRDHIEAYVAKEEARTQYSGGRKAWFVNIADAIVGIENMQRDRAERRLKVDSAWDDIRTWLLETFGSESPREPDQEPDQDPACFPDALVEDPVLPGIWLGS